MLSAPAFSETFIHTVSWEKGVNKKLIKEWTVSLDKISKGSSTTYIAKKVGGEDRLHRSKHRDVIVWIPESTDLSKKIKVVLWFHGHWGFVPKRTFEDRTLKQFVPMTSKKNFVLVIPEMPWSVHATTPTKRNSRVWTNPGEFTSFVKQVETILINHAKKSEKRLGKIDYRIVGHSAGGSTIKRIGITGDLCKLNPSLVVWSDSSYGQWLRDAWKGCLSLHPAIKIKVFVHKGGWPWRRGLEFMKEFQRPSNVELYIKSKGWSHKLIGDNVVKLSGVLD